MLRPLPNNQSLIRLSQNRSGKSNHLLRQGEIIKGKVIRVFKGGNIIISTKDTNLRAHSSLKLIQGEKYDFQVMSTGDKIELKVVNSGEGKSINPSMLLSSVKSSGSRLSELLSQIISIGSEKDMPADTIQILKKLSMFFNSSLQKSDDPDELLWINKNIQGSGLFWENKVMEFITGKKNLSARNLIDSDIKGLLLELDKSIRDQNIKDDHVILKKFSMKIEEAVNLINREQLMNLSAIREGIGWFVHLAGLDEDDFKAAELFVKNNKDDGIYFSIYLEMSKAGKMEIAVSVVKSIIGINFSVENEETADIVMDNINYLESALNESGLKSGTITCKMKEMDTCSDTIEKDFYSSVNLII